MSIARKILTSYRKIQYIIYGRHTYGIMPPGVLCTRDPFEEEINHGDVVHPCVRYIPSGFRGHKWWLVYTPYYAANAKIENPVLCWGKSENEESPTEWVVEELVKPMPEVGYNSDPNLLYDNGKLVVYWRECETQRVLKHGYHYMTVVKVYTETDSLEIDTPILFDERQYSDRGVSPAFIKLNGKYVAFAMNLRFKNEKLMFKNPKLRQLATKLVTATDIIGLYSQQKSFGIARWESNETASTFELKETNKIEFCNKLYRPWHLDVFEYEGKVYAVIQTNQCNADICLAESEDGIHFKMFKKPLMTNATCGKLGIYKPTALVVGGIFVLYYTAQDKNNRSLNKMYMTTLPFDDLLKTIG